MVEMMAVKTKGQIDKLYYNILYYFFNIVQTVRTVWEAMPYSDHCHG